MSEKEENKTPSQQPEAQNDPLADFSDELHIVDAMKPTAAPTSNNKPLRYGTRKKKAGEVAPVVNNLSSSSGFDDEEEEIEMDDLPIRANAPEELIDQRSNPSEPREEYGERRPRRNDRPQGERRERKPRERSPRQAAAEQSDAPLDNAEVVAKTKEEGDRPERFGTVKSPPPSASNSQVKEFRPTRDGRTAPKRERKPRGEENSSRPRAAAGKKKGFLARIIALFTGGDKKEEKPRSQNSNRDENRPRGERRPDNRQNHDGKRPDGEGGEKRRRRPRNRKPRPDGEGGDRPRREGGQNRRRGPRRPRREDDERSESDARAEGRRAREESESK